MENNDLLEIKTFQRLWKNRKENPKFCAFLTYLEIDLQETKLIQNDRYIILYDRKENEYIILLSKKHPLEEDFLLYKKQLGIQKQRIIFLD